MYSQNSSLHHQYMKCLCVDDAMTLEEAFTIVLWENILRFDF